MPAFSVVNKPNQFPLNYCPKLIDFQKVPFVVDSTLGPYYFDPNHYFDFIPNHYYSDMFLADPNHYYFDYNFDFLID